MTRRPLLQKRSTKAPTSQWRFPAPSASSFTVIARMSNSSIAVCSDSPSFNDVASSVALSAIASSFSARSIVVTKWKPCGHAFFNAKVFHPLEALLRQVPGASSAATVVTESSWACDNTRTCSFLSFVSLSNSLTLSLSPYLPFHLPFHLPFLLLSLTFTYFHILHLLHLLTFFSHLEYSVV